MDSAINIAIKTKLGELSKNGGLDALKAANPLLASQLEEMTAEKITVGECAKFLKGHFEGNLRTDGYKWAGDVKYTRTLNFDFTTSEITFVSDENRADMQTVAKTARLYGLQRYAQAEAIYTKTELAGKEYYEIKDEMKALKRNLRGLCAAEHQKLGFWFESLDVLEYEFIPHQNDEVPLYPIYVLFKDKKEKPYRTFIGWYSETDGKEKIDIRLNDLYNEPVYQKTKIVTPAEKRKKALVGCFAALAALAVIGGTVAYLVLSIL